MYSQLVSNPEAFSDKLYLPGASNRASRQWPAGFAFPATDFGPLPVPLDAFVKKFWMAAQLLAVKTSSTSTATDLTPILSLCRESFNEAVEYYGSAQQNVAEPILRAATKNYIYVGLLSNSGAGDASEEDDRIGDVFHSIKKCFTTMNKKEEGKRPILIFMFAECFKLMFKLKRLGMFPSILTSYQMLGAEKLMPRARKADCVQFLYYRALYEFHSQKIEESFERFVSAWCLLNGQDLVHQKRIAVYLVTIGLAQGRAFKDDFLDRFGLLSTFGPLCRAVRSGDLKGFKEAMQAASQSLIRLNVFVFLALNGELAVHLNAVKRTWRLAGAGKIVYFAQVNKLHEMLGSSDISPDEIECILINLIGKGWIRGHLGHDSGALVLSPTEPFPSTINIQ